MFQSLKILSSCFLLLWSFILQAQTTLTPGDIAIIGYDYDAVPQRMTIVTLAPINAGTKIYISDLGYDGSAFSATGLTNNVEGAIEWVTDAAITAGTVFSIGMASANAGTVVTGLPGTVTVHGWRQQFTMSTVNATNAPSAAGGESWFIYQGTDYATPVNFIFGWANWASITFGSANGWVQSPQSIGTNVQVSYLPSPLVNGTTAISLAWVTASGGSHGDNNVYTGIRTGTKAEILHEICDVSKWLTDETTVYDITVGGTYFPGANPVFTITATLPVVWLHTSATLQNGKAVIDWQTTAEVNNMNFTVQRSADGAEWKDLHTLPARGNNYSGASYRYVDQAPLTGTNYYRIRQTDIDGSYTYSLQLMVKNTGIDTDVKLYPQPASETLIIQRRRSTPAKVVLYNSVGMEVLRRNITGEVVRIPVQTLSRGYYLLQIISEGRAQGFRVMVE